MKKVRFITLGCRVNQYETQGMRESLAKVGVPSGHEVAQKSGRVDCVVINTCTVTAKADRENRYWIRRAKREHPEAHIMVTGCGVERDYEKIASLPEVDQIIRNHEKAEIASHLGLGCATPESQETFGEGLNKKHFYTPLSISESEGKTRAFIKIQDGCNHACSFCKVVLVRGRSRSRALPDIVEEVKRLRDAGYRDVVFAGIQLGAYGFDLEPHSKANVVDVLEACARIEGIERLRLSSIEPTDVAPELIEALAGIEKCAHHLHIPLQSGDSDILRAMNRRYDRRFYIDLVHRLKQAMPDFCLTLDVMAGFPGETQNHFANTMDLLKEVKPLRLHVFPYSSREGTRAARFAEEVADFEKKERVRQLIQLGEELGDEVRASYLGQVMPVLVEQSKSETPGSTEGVLHQGLTENYMKVVFREEACAIGQIVPIKLVALKKDYLMGMVADKETLEPTRGGQRATTSNMVE